MQKKQIVYWDSDCFLGFLKNEADKIKQCKGTTDNAERGNLIIVTSAITLIEVIKLDKHDSPLRLDIKSAKTIKEFFNNPYIYIHNVDSEIGTMARELIWNYNLTQRDSIHVATAIKLSLDKMHTFDIKLHSLNGKYGTPKLQICKPDIEYQMDFGDLTTSEEAEDEEENPQNN